MVEPPCPKPFRVSAAEVDLIEKVLNLRLTVACDPEQFPAESVFWIHGQFLSGVACDSLSHKILISQAPTGLPAPLAHAFECLAPPDDFRIRPRRFAWACDPQEGKSSFEIGALDLAHEVHLVSRGMADMAEIDTLFLVQCQRRGTVAAMNRATCAASVWTLQPFIRILKTSPARSANGSCRGGRSPGGKPSLCRTGDPFTKMWFRIAAPHRAALATGGTATRSALWRRYAAHLTSAAWEDRCRAAQSRLSGSVLGGAGPWGPALRYWKGNGLEWDVVAASIEQIIDRLKKQRRFAHLPGAGKEERPAGSGNTKGRPRAALENKRNCGEIPSP